MAVQQPIVADGVPPPLNRDVRRKRKRYDRSYFAEDIICSIYERHQVNEGQHGHLRIPSSSHRGHLRPGFPLF